MLKNIGKRIVNRGPAALFVLAVPLLLIIAGVTWAVNDLRLYEYGFDKRDISFRTGMEKDELMSAARQIRGYFNSTEEPVAIRSIIFGAERDLFNDREILHMKDVKHLIWGVYVIGGLSLIYMLTYAAAGFRIHGRTFSYPLARSLLRGSSLTVGFVLLVGFIAIVGFEGLFRAFHEISFANDFWQLNSRTDYLVIMFPNGFWFDATLFVGIVSVVGAVLLGTAAGGYLLLSRRRGKI